MMMFKGMMTALLVAMYFISMAGGATAGEIQSKTSEEEKAQIFLQLGHRGSVVSVAFSPDGRTVVSSSWDNTLKLWEVASGREIRTLSGHSAMVRSVAFSPDGRTLVSGSDDLTIKLWDVASGRELRTLSGHRGGVSSVAFSPDGRMLASGSGDRTTKLWDITSGQELRTLSGHRDIVSSVAFSPDGRSVVSGSHDNTLKLWDVASGQELRTLSGHQKWVTSVAFSPDGSGVVSGSGDNTLKLWDVASGRELRTLSGHSSTVFSVAFSPDGNTVVSGSEDQTIRLWDAASGRELHKLSGHGSLVDAVAFSPDGRTVVSGSWDNTLKLWDVASGRELRSLSGHQRHFSFKLSPDGRILASFDQDKTIKLWDIASGRFLHTLKGHSESVNSIAFSPDGHTLASASDDKTIRLWDVASRRELRVLSGNKFEVASVAFSPDGRTLVSSSHKSGLSVGFMAISELMLWDVASGRMLYRLGESAQTITDAAFSPDGRTIAASGYFGRIDLWDVASGKELRTLNCTPPFDFSPDSRTLIGHSEGKKTLTLLDISTGQALRTLGENNGKEIYSAAFSPDGRSVVSRALGMSIMQWDVASGQELRRLSGHQGEVRSVAFSPDGRTLVSGSDDQTLEGGSLASGRWDNILKLWDVATGQELHALNGHQGAVNSVVFAQNGKEVISGGSDGTVRVWDAATGNLKLTIVSFANDEWIAITPEGYYNASEQGGDWLNVRMGSKVQGINQFYDVFYRPDIVEAKLRGEDISGMTNLTIDDALRSSPPEVAFTTVPFASSGTKEKVCYKITSTGGGIGEVRLFQNGKLVKSDGFYREAVAKREDKMMLASADGEGVYRSMRALKMVKGESTIQVAKGKGDNVEECQEVEAIPGENELGITAFNAPNTVQSAMGHATFKSTRQPEAPQLYVLAIGIDEFSDSSVNLKYAAKDALDFEKLMQEKSGTMFGKNNIHVVTLSNAQASKQGILSKIDEMAGKVKPWDSFILFVASHGVMFGTQYYLVSSSFDGTADDKNLIGSNEIVELSKKIRALNQLYIFDTCHAGGVDNIVSGLYDARMSVLAKKMGLHIYASAGGLQEALDGYQGNGLFTHTLLASMNEASQTDLNHDGKVSVTELGKSARDMTNAISTKIGHPQTPTMIHFGKDVPVFEVRGNTATAAQAGPKPGATIKDCAGCPEMVVIPAGSFDMGDSDIKPVHEVTFAQSFAIGKTEVTLAQWKAIMGKGRSAGTGYSPSHPVTEVNWYDIQTFVQKLNAKTGKQYRLPTEAEWEYACRAGSKSTYCGGDNVDSVAWYNKNKIHTSHPVAQKKANAFGLYDMSGNIWEWVQDSCHPGYDGAPSDGSEWQGNGEERVLRGGSSGEEAKEVRAAFRTCESPDGSRYIHDFEIGFRLARTLP